MYLPLFYDVSRVLDHILEQKTWTSKYHLVSGVCISHMQCRTQGSSLKGTISILLVGIEVECHKFGNVPGDTRMNICNSAWLCDVARVAQMEIKHAFFPNHNGRMRSC